MWTPVYIELFNFLSIEYIKYNFSCGKNTMVYGINEDEGIGSDSNGSGKSNFASSGIRVATIGIERNEGKSDYVREGQKKANTVIFYENKAYKKTLLIKRTIFASSSPTKTIIEIDGVKDEEIISTDDANNRILELFDISKEDLFNYYIINQENMHSFFTATDTTQKKIISRFSDKGIIDSVIGEIEEDLFSVEEEIKFKQDQMTQIDSKIDFILEQINFEENERKGKFEEKVHQQKKYLTELQEKIEQKRLKNKRLLIQIKEMAKVQLKEFVEKVNQDKEKIEELKLNKQQKESKRSQNRKLIQEANVLLMDIKKHLLGFIECPKCHHSFSLDTNLEQDLPTLEASQKEINMLLEELKEQIETIDSEIEQIDEEVEKKSNSKEMLFDIKSKLRRLENEQEQEQDSIINTKNQLAEVQQFLSNKQKFQIDEDRIEELIQKKLTFKKQTKKLSLEIDELKEKKEEIVFWQINFGLKGFKTYLTNNVIGIIEGNVNNFLLRFKVNLKIKIEGFKKLKNGEIREKLSVKITKDGENWFDFKHFSGGQKKRCNVCSILTFQKLINQNSKYGGLDLLILDEFFEGLDVKGQKMVLKLLENIDTTNLVISHNNNDIGARNTLFLKMEEKITSICQEYVKNAI